MPALPTPSPGRRPHRSKVSCQLRIFSPGDVRATSYVRQQTVRQPDAPSGASQLAWGAGLDVEQPQEEDRPGDVTFRLFEGCAPAPCLCAWAQLTRRIEHTAQHGYFLNGGGAVLVWRSTGRWCEGLWRGGG